MTYNTDLMIDVLNRIEADPGRHDQRVWGWEPGRPGADCGTTRCIAGWACHLAGMEFTWVEAAPYDTGIVASRVIDPDTGSLLDPALAAASAMGVPYDAAHEMFFEMDSGKAVAMLRRLIEDGKNGAGA